MKTIVRILAVCCALVAAGLVAQPAMAGGTWTVITSPAAPGKNYFTFTSFGVTAATTVSGRASSDVTTVNIYCFFATDTNYQGPLNSSPIAVNTTTSPHTFSASGVHVPSLVPGCVLRAVPDSYPGLNSGTNTGYVAGFTGPNVYYGQKTVMKSGAGRTIHTAFETANPDGFVKTGTPDQTGVLELEHTDSLAKRGSGTPVLPALATYPQNVVPSSGTPTRSEIVIDGISAYLPATLDSFVSDHALVPSITATMSRSLVTGSVTTVETIPLRTCGASYPVSPPCTPQNPGVVMRRTIVTSHAGAVLTLRDVFTSTDHARHAVRMEYDNYVAPFPLGQPGVKLPGRSWRVPPSNVTVSTLPAGPHTIFLATDLNATDGDPNRGDLGITYSGKPTVYFNGNNEMAFRYTRPVRNGVPARMTFSMETARSMTQLVPLANAQQRLLTPHLAMTAPRSTTTDNTPTVRGRLTNATNGLQAKVRITVGTTSKTVAVRPDGRFEATFSLPNGKHMAKAKATDPSGLVLTAARTFTVA